MKAMKSYMEDVIGNMLHRKCYMKVIIHYMEDVIWRMYMEKLYKGDKTLYGRCFMEDVFI